MLLDNRRSKIAAGKNHCSAICMKSYKVSEPTLPKSRNQTTISLVDCLKSLPF